MSATDYFRRNCWISTECEDPFVSDVIRWMGDDHIVYETDFPHPDSKYPHATDELLRAAARSDLRRQQAQDPLGQRRRPLPLPRSMRRPSDVAQRRRVSTGLRRHYQAVDYDEIARLYPPPPEYYESAYFEGPEQIERKQLARLKTACPDRYQVPFLRRSAGTPRGSTPDRSTASMTSRGPRSTRSTTSARASRPTRPGATTRASRPTRRCASRCGSTCPAGRPASSRPTFYTQWDREVGTPADGQRPLRAGHPAR